jgi:hypothetical protein
VDLMTDDPVKIIALVSVISRRGVTEIRATIFARSGPQAGRIDHCPYWTRAAGVVGRFAWRRRGVSMATIERAQPDNPSHLRKRVRLQRKAEAILSNP